MANLNTYEDEAIKVYTFSIVDPGLFGGKLSIKSDIGPLTDCTKGRNKSFQTGLEYDTVKILDLFHWDIKMIIMMKYQYSLHLRALATAMALEAVEIISDIFRWVEYTYKLLMA